MARIDRYEFLDEAGALLRVHVPAAFVEACIDEGTPFMTNRCPDRNGKVACNRPFGSYRPGDEFRDYPFHPTADDLTGIRRQLRAEGIIG